MKSLQCSIKLKNASMISRKLLQFTIVLLEVPTSSQMAWKDKICFNDFLVALQDSRPALFKFYSVMDRLIFSVSTTSNKTKVSVISTVQKKRLCLWLLVSPLLKYFYSSQKFSNLVGKHALYIKVIFTLNQRNAQVYITVLWLIYMKQPLKLFNLICTTYF